MAVDPRNPLAIYRQIAADIAERIDAGEFADTMLIPSEAEICEAYDVSRKTARAAVALLAEEGRVVPVQGKGVFVKADARPPADSGEQAGG